MSQVQFVQMVEDMVPSGAFFGEKDEIPVGTFHGEKDEIPVGTFH